MVLELVLPLVLLFVVSWLDVLPDAEPLAEPELGVADDVSLDGAEELDEDEDAGADGVLLEPEPAEPLTLLELEGAVDDGLLLMSTEVDEELEPEGAGAVLGAAVVPPADEDEDAPAGARVAPDGAVVELELEAPSLGRSQAAINEAPNASDTATAIVESLMRPPRVGVTKY